MSGISKESAGRRATPRRPGRPRAPSASCEASLVRRALALARLGYWLSESPDAEFLWVSPELALMYGVPPQDGRAAIADIRSRYSEADGAMLRRRYDQCWQDGLAYCVTGTYRHPDGRLVDYSIHGEAERNRAGRVVRVSGIVRDITDEQAALRASAESERKLADFLDTATDWCWETDADHRFDQLSHGGGDASAAFGYSAAGDRRWELPIVPEDHERMVRHRADVEAHRPFRHFDYTVRTPSGARTVRTSGKPVFDAQGGFLGYRGTATDITELRRAEALLLQRSAALAQAQRLGRMGSWSYRLGDARVCWTPELYALTGHDPAAFDTTHAHILSLVSPEDAAKLIAMQKEVLRRGGAVNGDIRVRRKDGTMLDFAVACTAEVVDGRVVGFVGTMQDVSERKTSQRQLEKLAYTDALTGVANRALFKDRLAETIARTKTGPGAALLFLDLDRFKEVNDSLGHAAGDELLCRVAGILREELGPEAFIARLGGDEFAMLVERTSVEAEMTGTAERLIARLSQPMELSSGEAYIGATVGIARLPEDGTTAAVAMRHADLALYAAKETGRSRCAVFAPAYAEAVEQRLDLARHLRRAVEGNALHAHYQPQVDLHAGKVVGFEALLRWTHPEKGPISPSEFVPVAESSGLIVDLGLWVLREACLQGRRWLDAGLPARTVSVNVSPAQFWNMDFETAVSAVLAETGLPPNLLCLELTENLFVDQNEQRISRTLAALSVLGVRLALDDFGSGYSSLGYLTRLPFDRLKVDRFFVDGVAVRPDKRKLLGGIIALARGLGMTVVAEGAERMAEVDVLVELGCDIVQGFVFSRPVAADAALRAAEAIEQARRADPPRLELVAGVQMRSAGGHGGRTAGSPS